MNLKEKFGRGLAIVTVSALPALSYAQTEFTVPTEITEAATSVGLVGAAVFAVMVGIKLYKWLRRAL